MTSEQERKLDLIDENENIIGQASRSEIHEKGLLHREVHVWLYTNDGKIIFQKRSATKDTYPNLLDASAGGHIEVGQTPAQAALAELEEEAGIHAKESDLRFIKKDRGHSHDPQTDKQNNVIRYVYAYKTDSNPGDLVVEEGKSDGFEAYTVSELENLDDTGRARFISKILEPKQIEMYTLILNNT